jgi:hypothetical protein
MAINLKIYNKIYVEWLQFALEEKEIIESIVERMQ